MWDNQEYKLVIPGCPTQARGERDTLVSPESIPGCPISEPNFPFIIMLKIMLNPLDPTDFHPACGISP